MKKLLFAAMALVLSASAWAKTADELRIYINPGHGSWYSNDRPMDIQREIDGQVVRVNPNTSPSSTPTNVPDTTAFYESNTNLRKGFGVLEELVKYGLKFDRTLNQDLDLDADPFNLYRIGAARDMSNNIVMSHVKCGPFPAKGENVEICNRSLSEICREVEANNFDMFISIHSNAATEGTTTNYPLYLYRGYDSPKEVEGCTLTHQETSRAMADASWPYAIENKHGMWTAYTSSKNLRGDFDFYGSSSTSGLGYKGYLGVLKSGAPGFLVEGYFHTYQPARHRALNWDVDYVEGYAYARGIADYFGLTKTGKGWIYGIVRDANEKFAAAYYKPNPSTLDRFRPINNCTVILKKDGTEVARKVTDNNFNGAFVFMDLEPGEYTIEFDHENYYPGEAQTVTVEADKCIYPAYQLVNTSYEEPTIVYVNYPDLYTTSAESVAKRYTVEQSTAQIEELAGKTLRRMVQHGDYLYILAIDAEGAPTLIVYDPAKKEVVANVSTEGMTVDNVNGPKLICSDIQVTADGYLLACNKQKTQLSTAYVDPEDNGIQGTFRVYKWANDKNGLPTGAPELWVTSQMTGNWYRSYAGDTFAYTGTTEEGSLVFSNETTGSSRNLRTTCMSILDGKKGSENFYQPWYNGSADGFTVATLGDNYKFVTSPLDDNRYYVVGEGNVPVLECSFDHISKAEVHSVAADALPASHGSVGMFKYIGKSLLAYPELEDGQVVGVSLANISDNIAKATNIRLTNGAVEPAEVANAGAAGATKVIYDDLGEKVVGGWYELYLLAGDKLTTFTTKGVEQPVQKAAYAYELSATENESDYTISYKATDDALAAKLVIYADEEVVIEMGEAAKGENTYTLDRSLIPGNEGLNWAVVLESEPITSVGRAFSANKSLKAATRGGVKMMDDPNYASYGKIVMSYGFAQGLEVYDQELNSVGTYWVGDSHFNAANGASTMRLGTWQGKAYICDWSDAGAGYWIFDPENPAEPKNFLAGTKNSGGNYSYNGTSIGGGATDIQFYTDAEGKTTMYVWCEDYPEVDGNHLISYEVTPDMEQIDFAPQDWGFSGLMANTNIALFPTSKGLFMAQTRGNGNDASGCPSFVGLYYDEATNSYRQFFNSATDEPVLNASCGGFAVSDDESTIVVASATNGLSVFEAVWGWDEDFDHVALTMNHLYDIPGSISRDTTANEWTQLDFDPAGNLLAYERAYGLSVYALKNDAPKATTPAPATSLIKGVQNAVSEIAVEAAQGDAIYYNLQGQRVNSANLSAGIYIKVQGKKAQKVLVK